MISAVACFVATGKIRRACLIVSIITSAAIIAILLIIKCVMFSESRLDMGVSVYIAFAAVVIGLISGRKRERR